MKGSDSSRDGHCFLGAWSMLSHSDFFVLFSPRCVTMEEEVHHQEA